jgi:plastocyanin
MHDSKRRSWGRSKTYIVAGAAAAAALAAGPLLAAAPNGVRGKLAGWEKLVPQVYSEAAGDSHRYTWREPSPTVKSEFRKLSANVSKDVCVAAFGAGGAAAHDPIAVKVTGGRVSPSTLVLSPGSRISFKNDDPFPHQLYEVTDAKWAPNPTAPGSTREWAGTTPGLHVIRDQLFPSVVMYVQIDPAAVEVGVPDHDGNFSIPVAPGDYTLKAFFEGKPVGKPVEGVHVGAGGLELKEPITMGGAGGGETK